MAANTFVELNDTPSNYTGAGNKFLVIKGDESAVNFTTISMEKINDVNVTGAYIPTGGQVLQYSSAGNEWRAMDNDPYSFGAGLLKSAGTIDVIASSGLVANASGVHIEDIANVAGTYGNASSVPQFTVNTKGQVTGVTLVDVSVPSSDALTADYVGNIIGTAGQIRVTGGTGNNSNATIDLVATGVTSGVYGNATHAPVITVDTYGRLQNVDLVEMADGSGGANAGVLAYKTIDITDSFSQTSLSADAVDDTLTFIAGTGVTLTTDASNDSITFGMSGSVVAGSMSLGQISDVDTSGISDGQVLKWVDANSSFEAFSLSDQVGISLTDLSGTSGVSYDNTSGAISLADSGATAGTYGDTDNVAQVTVNDKGIVTNITNVSIRSASGVTAGTYGNATTVPQITVGADGRVTSIVEESSAAYIQSLSWNAAEEELTLSGANTIDLGSLSHYGFRSIAVLGQNTIIAEEYEDTINFAGGAGINVTLNEVTDTITISATGSAAANIESSSIADLSDVGTIGSITDGQVLVWNAGASEFRPAAQSGGGSTTLLGLTDVGSDGTNGQVLTTDGSGNFTFTTPASAYGDSDVGSYLTAQGYATQATIVAAITDSAPNTLDTLNELANALGDDPNFATTITNNLALKANSADLATVATSGSFTDLTSRPTISLSGNDLTYDGTTLDLSGLGATGPQGATGAAGADGADGADGSDGADGQTISSGAVSGGVLTLTMNDASTVTVSGSVTGATGSAGTDGDDGVGITSVNLVGSNLVLNYSNTSSQDIGAIVGADGADSTVAGPQGPAGTDGTSISSGSVTNGVITLTMSDSSTINVSGNVQGATGATGPQGTQGATGAQGPAGNDGADGIALTDLSVSTGIASGGGSFSYAGGTGVFTYIPPDLSSFITSETDSQELSLSGNVISLTGQSGNVDLTSILGAVNTDAQDLTLSGNVISLTGQSGNVDLTSLLAGSGGGATTLDGLTDVSASSPSSGQVLKWNGSAWAPAADNNSGGGGGGSGATVQRFKLNYTSSGALDSITDTTSGISSVSIDSATGGDVTIAFTGFNYPPASITIYGYVYASNKYQITPLETSMGLREVAGGGSAGAPSLFNGSGVPTTKLRLREAETGASRSFGTVTHAWVQFVMYD